ncbi:MAG: 6-phospho-beta-glucosidase [Anaerolineae bacterium]
MKLTIIGTAGVRTPLVLRGILRHQNQLNLTDLYLMDIDAEHLELIRMLCEPILRREEVPFRTIWTTNAREAIEGADYVLTTFRVGGIRSRVADERVPLRHRVLGQETTGPGGFAMALRTIPVIFHYVQLMGELAPKAWLINFTNPSGLITEAIINHAGFQKVVGICDNPAAMQRELAKALQIPPQELLLEYFGLNHLGWIKAAFWEGRDILPEIIAWLSQHGETIPGLPFDPRFIAALGMIPNEYLYFYYHNEEAVQHILAAGKTRGEQIQELNEWLFAELKRLRAQGNEEQIQEAYISYLVKRGETYMATETGHKPFARELVKSAVEEEGYEGVALGVMECLSGAQQGIAILNVPNRGAIAGMKEQDVVEVTCYLGKSVVRPIAIGSVPDHALGLMKQVKEYERLTIEAALSSSYQLALNALSLHPLVPSYEIAKRILDEYIQVHAGLFPPLH